MYTTGLLSGVSGRNGAEPHLGFSPSPTPSQCLTPPHHSQLTAKMAEKLYPTHFPCSRSQSQTSLTSGSTL